MPKMAARVWAVFFMAPVKIRKSGRSFFGLWPKMMNIPIRKRDQLASNVPFRNRGFESRTLNHYSPSACRWSVPILSVIGGAGGEQGAMVVEHVSIYFALLRTLSGRDLTWCSFGARGAPSLSRRFFVWFSRRTRALLFGCCRRDNSAQNEPSVDIVAFHTAENEV